MKKIKIIYVGGTIGMVKSDKGVYVPFSADNLMSYVPEVNQLGVELEIESFKNPLDSAFVGPKEWNELANRVFVNYEIYDGFVVLHGTDTMAYTSSALSFMLKGIDKPVIFTGSQIPISEHGSDGVGNFINAVKLAKEGLVNEVAVWFHKSLFRGVNVSKVDTQNFDGFASPNHEVLATLTTEFKYNSEVDFLQKEDLNFIKASDVLIKMLDLSPGINLELESKQILRHDFKGAVLKTFGSGTSRIKEGDDLYSVLKSKGFPIVVISECLKGGVTIGKYEAGTSIEKLNIIAGEKMTKEAALTKMIIGCTNYSGAALVSYLSENQVGEF